MSDHIRTMRLLIVSCFLLLIIPDASMSRASERSLHDRTAVGKVEEAYRLGRIDSETALLYRMYAIRDYGKLPDEFRSEKPTRCGTLSLLEVRRSWDALSKRTKDKLQEYVGRPGLSGPEHEIVTTHFKIHYTTSGIDAVTAQYATNISDYAEESWNKEVEDMGWDAPPPDGVDGDKYDIYIIDSGSSGWIGYCAPEAPGPDPGQEDYTSYIAVADNLDQWGWGVAKVTVAHEFNHACQFSYSGWEADFWYENCAVWMEDMVYDRVNDYYYYITPTWENPIHWPEFPMNRANGEYEYGACVWVFYLTEKHNDNDMPRRIWDRNGTTSGNETIADINSILSTHYGSSFNEALKEYSVWRYFCGSNNDGQHFSEGGNWVDPYVEPSHVHSSYPAQGTPGSKPPDRYGTNFIQFNFPGGEGLNITFDGCDGYNWAAMVAQYPGTDYTEISLDANDSGTAFLEWDSSTRFILVPVVLSSSGSSLFYSYSADQGADEAPPTMEPIAEPQGHWYDTAPQFSNFGFDDNVGLDDGWYQLNSCVGSWTSLFTNASGSFWDDDGWTIPGFSSLPEGGNTIYFKADDDAGHVGGGCNWNWQFNKDTVPPNDPTNVTSPSHRIGVWSKGLAVIVTWRDATDPGPGSGLDGYSTLWNTSSGTVPDPTKEIEENVEVMMSPALGDGKNHYFHIRSADNAGNWQSTVHLGPFWIDGTGPTDGTISVNDGADSTASSLVTLNTLSAVDAMSGMGSGAQMRFSNDGMSWSDAEDFASARFDWDVTAEAYGGDPFDGLKTVYVQYKDVAGNWSEAFYDAILYHPQLTILSDVLPDGYVGFAYQESLLAVGGTRPYDWNVASGLLPEGLSMDSGSGVISGTPGSPDTADVTFEVTDAEEITESQDLSIIVHMGSKGDVNVDGEVNIIDALLAMRMLLGEMIPNDYEHWAADCNGNGEVNIMDVLGIVNVSLGIGTCPPTNEAASSKRSSG